GRYFGDCQGGREETAGTGPPGRGGAVMRRDGWALAFAMVFPSLSAWLYFVAFSGGSDSGGSYPPALAVWLAGKLIQFSFPLVWIWGVEHGQIQTAAPTRRGLTLGAGFGFLVAAAGLALYFGLLRYHPLFREAPARVADKVSRFGVHEPNRYIVFVAFL